MIEDVCAAINKSTIRAHRRYLRSAQYAALGIPEFYIQSESFIELSRIYSREYDLIMEPKLSQLGLTNLGNVDLVIGNFYDPSAPKTDFIVEFKKLNKIDSFYQDLSRLIQIIDRGLAKVCIISAYTARSSIKNIDEIIENSKNSNEIFHNNNYLFDYFRSDTVYTVGRPQMINGTLRSGVRRYFSNICISIRKNFEFRTPPAP